MWLSGNVCGGPHSHFTGWESEVQRREGSKGWREEPGFGSREMWASAQATSSMWSLATRCGENHLFFTSLDVLTSSSLIDSQVHMNLTPWALLLSAAVWDPCRQVLLHLAQTSLLALSGLSPLIPQQHFEAEATVIPSLYMRSLMPREVK